jgi:hypothetical protein
MGPSSTVQVDCDVLGRWHVIPSADKDECLCATFAEASDFAVRWAGEHRPCELIVRDAYHRVVRREVLDEDLALLRG